MSKTNTKHHQVFYRHPIFWVAAVILVLVIVATILVITAKPPVETAPSTPENPHTVISHDDNNNQPTDTQTDAEPDDKVSQYEGENPNTLSDLTGSITYKGVDNGILTVSVMIDQFLSDGGTCTLELTGRNQGGYYTVTNPAFADISTSACQTFEIPISNLPSDHYALKIRLSDNNKNGLIEEEVSL